jgi:hypothetical protein
MTVKTSYHRRLLPWLLLPSLAGSETYTVLGKDLNWVISIAKHPQELFRTITCNFTNVVLLSLALLGSQAELEDLFRIKDSARPPSSAFAPLEE